MGFMTFTAGVEASPKRMDLRDWAVLALSFAVAVSFGLCYGDANSNQTTYLLEGIGNAHPELWKNDWYVSQTTHYHKLFTYLVTALENFGILPWGLAVLNVAAITATLYAIYFLAGTATEAKFRVWLLTVAVFVLFYRTRSVGFSYVFTTGMQPSALAGMFFVFAACFFAAGRYPMSGLMLGVSGIFHANYGVLAIPVFAAAHLLLDRRNIWPRLLWQLAFPVLAILAQLPMMLQIAGLDLSREVRDFAHTVFVNIALPFHYKTDVFLIELLPFAAWALLAYDPLKAACERAGKRVGEDGALSGAARLKALFMALLLFNAFYFVFSSLLPVDFLVRLCVFRVAPYLLMISVIFFSAAMVGGEEIRGTGRLRMFRLLLAAAFFARYMFFFGSYEQALFIAAALALVPWSFQGRVPGTLKYVTLALALAIGLYSAWDYQDTYMKKHKYTLLLGDHPDTEEFYSWVRSTDRDAVFLTPPVMNEFRVLGLRAAVVDWQGIPFRPDELLIWYSRMKDVTDNGTGLFYKFVTAKNIYDPEYLKHLLTGGHKKSYKSTEQYLISNLVAVYVKGYDNVITRKLPEIAGKYGANYMVCRKDLRITDLAGGNAVFENKSYVVYKIGGKAGKN